MDVLYILGDGSKWENREIIYSIRTLAKLVEVKGSSTFLEQMYLRELMERSKE